MKLKMAQDPCRMPHAACRRVLPQFGHGDVPTVGVAHRSSKDRKSNTDKYEENGARRMRSEN